MATFLAGVCPAIIRDDVVSRFAAADDFCAEFDCRPALCGEFRAYDETRVAPGTR